MKKVGIYEAKTQFSRLIADVRRGEEVIVLDRGRPVAKLVALTEAEGASGDSVTSFRALRARARKVSRKEARAWVEAGRK